MISEEIRLEMNTNDAKEYLARREIPQLFEVRHGVRFAGMRRSGYVRIFTQRLTLLLDALQNACQSHGKDLFMRCNASYYGGWRCEYARLSEGIL